MQTQVEYAEGSVIGSLLISPESLEEIEQAGLTKDDFIDERCRCVLDVICELRDTQGVMDPVSICAEASTRGYGDLTVWIANVMQNTPTAANVKEYCRIVKQESRRRKIQQLFSDAAFNVEIKDYQTEIETVISTLQKIEQDNAGAIYKNQDLYTQFIDFYQKTKLNPENAYCRTGYQYLDLQFGGGMFKSEVYVIGARPGMGKTTLGINIAENVVKTGKAVLFVSMEMTKEQITAKRIAIESGLSYTSLMTGRLTEEQELTMIDIANLQCKRPFFLTTRSNLTVRDIARCARQIPDLSLVIIDYLGLVCVPQESQKKPRYEQMTEISAGIKALAKALNIPVLALSQLNRENTQRSDKRPTMSDLRDSGAVEQDAGAVILLHRPEYYEQKEQTVSDLDSPDDSWYQVPEEIELNVAKNRHHSPGVVHMMWDGRTGRILSKAVGPQQAPRRTISEEEELPF